MAIDFETVKALAGTNPAMKSTFDAVGPYLPVLKRLGKDGLDVFLDGVKNQDWDRIDRELYAKMTEDERDALSADVLKAARDAVKLAHEADREWQGDLLRLALSLVLSLI